MQLAPSVTADFSPIHDEDWPVEIADMLAGFAGGLNVYRTMAHHPALLRAWADLRDHVVHKTTLGPQNSEVVILRTGARLGSHYEWHQHISRARKAGLSDARIAQLGGPLDRIDGDDALLAAAVDALHADHYLPLGIQERLLDRFGPHALLDLIATVGFYTTLAYLLNSFETPLDQNIVDELAQNPLAPKP